MSRRRVDEVYVSTDVEADGPIPGPHSMLSLGSAAYDRSGQRLSTFSVNIAPLPGACPDPDTLKWWMAHPDAWAEVNKDPVDAATAIRRYVDWVLALPGKPVFVGYPTGYDFTFVYWYCVRFTGSSPFSFSALDIKTMAMTMLRTPYRETSKKTMPRRWFTSGARHTHVALDDALEQGELFCATLKENFAGATQDVPSLTGLVKAREDEVD